MIHTKVKRIVKRVLLSLLIFVLSFSVLSMMVTVIFFHTAYPRSDTPRAYSYAYEDIDADAYPARQIRFSSGDHTLTGYCYTCPSPCAVVVIAAGFRESGAMHLSEMMAFVQNGYDVFCYDATGVGESEGSSTVGLSQPSLDLRAALQALDDDPQLCELPALLYGHSAGGYAAAVCADMPVVRAAVIVSGFESPTLLMRETARSYVGFLADVEYPFLALESKLVFSEQGNRRASECIKSADVPIAVYEGADDTVVPPSVRLSRYLDRDNPDLTLTICEDAPRCGHSDLWLSDEAISARESEAPDPARANALDSAFIDSVLLFYRNALKLS